MGAGFDFVSNLTNSEQKSFSEYTARQFYIVIPCQNITLWRVKSNMQVYLQIHKKRLGTATRFFNNHSVSRRKLSLLLLRQYSFGKKIQNDIISLPLLLRLCGKKQFYRRESKSFVFWHCDNPIYSAYFVKTEYCLHETFIESYYTVFMIDLTVGVLCLWKKDSSFSALLFRNL